jgi:hypothetical protein
MKFLSNHADTSACTRTDVASSGLQPRWLGESSTVRGLPEAFGRYRALFAGVITMLR